MSRSKSFSKGIKQGVIKKSVDKAVSPVTGPVAEKINAKLQEIHPNTKLAAPMVESALKCAMIMGFAELLDVAAPFVGEKTNFDPQKVSLASEFMREYAGEKVGEDVVDLALQFVPIIMSAFTEFSVSDLQYALADGEEETSSPKMLEEPKDNLEVPKLSEDEEDSQPMPVRKKGKVTKLS